MSTTMQGILHPKETTVVNGRPSRGQLANTERVSGCTTRVLKSNLVVLEKGVRSERLRWSSRCKIPVQGTSKPGIMLHSDLGDSQED